MAVPMTATRFVKLLNDWSIPYTAYDSDWDVHNRNTKGEWGPVNGVMIHHTGSDAQSGMPAQLWNGYPPALPGPLCHGGIDVNGKVILTGWGRCNHAGGGDPDVLRHVIAEDYTGQLKPKYTNTSGVDGNAHFYGFEVMYDGSHAMSKKQMETSTRLAAAICTYHNWGRRSVIGHGEWQLGKWDPGIIPGKMTDMNAYRTVVDLKIKAGPPAKIPPSTVVPYTIKQGDSLYAIAKKLLGNEHRWPEIVEENKKLFPLTLLPGSIIKIPKK